MKLSPGSSDRGVIPQERPARTRSRAARARQAVAASVTALLTLLSVTFGATSASAAPVLSDYFAFSTTTIDFETVLFGTTPQVQRTYTITAVQDATLTMPVRTFQGSASGLFRQVGSGACANAGSATESIEMAAGEVCTVTSTFNSDTNAEGAAITANVSYGAQGALGTVPQAATIAVRGTYLTTSLSQSSFNFVSPGVTPSAPKTLSMTNAAVVPMTAVSAGVTRPAYFSIDTGRCPPTLQPGETCSVDVTFTPNNTTSRQAILWFNWSLVGANGLVSSNTTDRGIGLTGDVGVVIEGTPPAGVVGATYSFAFAIAAPAAFSATVVSGALPDGLTMSTAGVITGTPTVTGTFPFGVRASTSTVGTNIDAVITITAAPTITGTPPAGIVDQAYDYTFTTTGTPTPQVTLTDGELPDGLTLDDTGHLTGTPTTPGTFDFELTATNGTTPNATLPTSITITAAPMSSPHAWMKFSQVDAGGSQTVLGAGFASGESVDIEMRSDPVRLATVVATTDGTVELEFVVPLTTTAGEHAVTLTGQESGAASASFSVRSPSEAQSTHGVLAVTGLSVLGLFALAVCCALAGAMLRARRRPAKP